MTNKHYPLCPGVTSLPSKIPGSCLDSRVVPLPVACTILFLVNIVAPWWNRVSKRVVTIVQCRLLRHATDVHRSLGFGERSTYSLHASNSMWQQSS